MGQTSSTLALEKQVEDQKRVIKELETSNERFIRMFSEKALSDSIANSIKHVKEERGYEYLVLSGGGIKGISFIGALRQLKRMGILYDSEGNFKLKGIAGVSAGSIIVSLLAIGYKPKELEQVMSSIDFSKLASSGYIGGTINFFEDWGLSDGDYILDLLGELIKSKTGNADYTLKDVWNDKKVKLVIGVTNVSCERSEYLHAEHNNPEYSSVPIRVAVRMSMSIPGVFGPYLFGEHKDYFVDGGTLDNFPLHVFDGEYPGDPEARLNLCKPNSTVLGIKITTDKSGGSYNDYRMTFNSMFCYFSSFIQMFLHENDRRNMVPSYWLRTIIIKTPQIPLSKFDISPEEKKDLLNNGTDCTINFFKD